jgi:hypothetical protein
MKATLYQVIANVGDRHMGIGKRTRDFDIAG